MEHFLFEQIHYERKPEYGLRTRLVERNGQKIVIKKPLRNQAFLHIKGIFENAKNIEKQLPQIKLPKINLLAESVEIEYISGKTLEAEIEEALIKGDYQKTETIINDYLKFIRSLPTIHVNPYDNPNYAKLLDPKEKYNDKKKYDCIKIGIFDINFDNFIRQDNDYYFIDAEWCFDFNIPSDYMILRAVFYLCTRLRKHIETMVSVDFPCYNVYQDILFPVHWLNKVTHSPKLFQRILDFDYNLITSTYTIDLSSDQTTHKNYADNIIVFPINASYSSLPDILDSISKYRRAKTIHDPLVKIASYDAEIKTVQSKLLDLRRELQQVNKRISELSKENTRLHNKIHFLSGENSRLKAIEKRFESRGHQLLVRFESIPILNNKYFRKVVRTIYDKSTGLYRRLKNIGQ